MELELDHFFILTADPKKTGDRLASLGLQESFSRDHPGQGTSNRRFELSNCMLELLWLRDKEEARRGPGKKLMFPERLSSRQSSPFGFILTRKNNLVLEMPFDGWTYQPDFFKAPMAFHVGDNSSRIEEPLCIYAPFMEPVQRKVEVGEFKSVTSVSTQVAVSELSDCLSVVGHSDGLLVKCGPEHLLEVTFDNGVQQRTRDLRPELPLVVHW